MPELAVRRTTDHRPQTTDHRRRLLPLACAFAIVWAEKDRQLYIAQGIRLDFLDCPQGPADAQGD